MSRAQLKSQKLLIVSNRLPVSVAKEAGKLTFDVSYGGLATGLASLGKTQKRQWVGWPGIASEDLTAQEKKQVTVELRKHDCIPVFLTKAQVNNYYFGYSNGTLWPLFHYFTQHTQYQSRFWSTYQKVNKIFYDAVLGCYDKNTTIWVHDYQLMLLPQMIREKLPTSSIGFFLHIPFPSYEIFRLLPNRAMILRGLLGADLIGFHTYDYTRHFLSSVLRILGLNNNLGVISFHNRIIRTDSFPIGIDYQKYAKASTKTKVKKEIAAWRKEVKGKKLLLSFDRADYSKGILERLRAYDYFLAKNPSYIGKVVMIVVASPSRMQVDAYQDLRKEIEGTVSHINGKYSQVGWSPISYHYRSISFEHVTALYYLADIALVTPLRDGMNLIAKEYVAVKQQRPGVLILSEMAGAASELPEALMVNPNNRESVADAIKIALDLSPNEQKHNLRLMQERIKNYDIKKWAKDFVDQLNLAKENQADRLNRGFSSAEKRELIDKYKHAKQRLILLDYDGTLVDFAQSHQPVHSAPPKKLLTILERLATSDHNEIVIISGRPKTALENWFGHLPINLVAEHGAWAKEEGNWRQQRASQSNWKSILKPILLNYVDRTAGSLLEEKDFALVWHYRKVSPALAGVRKAELRHDIQQVIKNTSIGLFEGSKIFEIKPKNIHKGSIARQRVENTQRDFILAIGDDYTDEDMFKALPRAAHTIKVGFDESEARFHVQSPADVIKLLEDLSKL